MEYFDKRLPARRDDKSDVFALGCTVFSVLARRSVETGKPPIGAAASSPEAWNSWLQEKLSGMRWSDAFGGSICTE